MASSCAPNCSTVKVHMHVQSNRLPKSQAAKVLDRAKGTGNDMPEGKTGVEASERTGSESGLVVE